MPDAVKLFSEIDQQFLELERQFDIINKQREEIELCKKKTFNASKKNLIPSKNQNWNSFDKKSIDAKMHGS